MNTSTLRKLIAGVAISFAAVSAAAVPAVAATAPASIESASTHNAVTAVTGASSSDHVQIARTCPVHGHNFTIYRSNCSGAARFLCIYNSQGALPYSPSYASNGCNVRVYLYTGPHKTGHILCINPDGFPGNATGLLRTHYVWALITSDKNRC
jgi:hypothetical protein